MLQNQFNSTCTSPRKRARSQSEQVFKNDYGLVNAFSSGVYFSSVYVGYSANVLPAFQVGLILKLGYFILKPQLNG